MNKALNAVKSSKGDVRWLEKGKIKDQIKKEGYGWIHIKQKHIENPKGNEFVGKFGSKYSDEKEVQKLIMQSIEKGKEIPIKTEKGGYTYQYEVQSGKWVKTIVGSNGYIETSHPS